MERRQATGGQRRLENLRQKRNALRTRSEDVKGWAGGGGGGSAPLSARQLGPDAAVLAAAARRRQQAYALSSSSSSSDCEEGPGGASEAAPTSQELTAKLFAKLGIKGGGGGRAVGFDSDSSWASSPERSARIKAVAPGSAAPDGSSGSCGGEASHLHAQLEQAQGTIAALQQEVAAARVQADSATQQLRAAESYAQDLEVRLHAAEQALAAAAGGGGEAGESHSSAAAAAAAASSAEAQELAAANYQLQEEVAELGSQLAEAATWQQEVHAMQAQLGGMQAAVADSEAARQQQHAELGGLLQQREQQLLAATARLAATEAQLAALQAGGGGGDLGGAYLRPAAELLAQFAVSHAQLTAALGEAATLLA